MLNPKTGQKWKVFVGIPSTGKIHDFLPYVLRDLQDRYGEEVEFVYPPQLTQRVFHDYARNGVVEEFLESGADILWFIDSDITPPKHVLDLVTMHGDKWECAGAPYPVFMAAPGDTQRNIVFCVYQMQNGKLSPAPVPFRGEGFVDGLATGCLMIKREVFDKLEKPYFEFKFDPETKQPILGEDLGFCIKMNKLGIKFFTDYSMVCKHQKEVCLLEVNNYCIEYANKQLLGYDAQVREQFKKLEAEVVRLQKELKQQQSLKVVQSAPHGFVNRKPVDMITKR